MSSKKPIKENMQKYLDMNNISYSKKDTKKDLINRIIKI